MREILIVIPAYNEEMNIEEVVNNIIINYPEYDYIIVNDGSSDNTRDICMKNGFNVLNLPINLGLKGAFQTGMRYAYEKGYRYSIQIDADGQHDPLFVDKMLATISSLDLDIVIGSRFLEERKLLDLRMLGSNIIGLCILITTGTWLSDPTSGLRLYSRRVMKEFAYNINYAPEPDTISHLIKQGNRIKEVQVKMYERMGGVSYLNMRYAIKYMILMCFSILFVQGFRKER